jgi:hypothetical protein
MQMPSVDRTPIVRPAADVASSAVNRVIPVAPVNPPVQSVTPAEPSPSVIDMVNPALKTNEGERVYTSVSDPGRAGSEAATTPKDWTIRRPAPEKAEAPPPKPMAQILMDHLRTVWSASASAIHIEQAKARLEQPLPVNPALAPGNLAKEVLTYEPAKIKKNDKL